MKNLNTFVETVWGQTTPETKLEAFNKLIEASQGSKMKKHQTLQQAKSCTMQQLDSLAINYAMVGDGLGVIK
jgi:hypothetical protein